MSGRDSSNVPLDAEQWEEFQAAPVAEAPLPPRPDTSAARGGGYLTPSPGAAAFPAQLPGAPRRARLCWQLPQLEFAEAAASITPAKRCSAQGSTAPSILRCYTWMAVPLLRR